MERRKNSISKSSSLPLDYLTMVSDIFSNHFEEGLKIYRKIKPEATLEARGRIFSDEVLLAVSLINGEELAATTVLASCDFDPKASAPKVDDILAACVDSIESVLAALLNPEDPGTIQRVAEESLSAMENIPFLWSPVKENKISLFIKVDKSNPKIDEMTENWLKSNDPAMNEIQNIEKEATEDLFFTGPKNLKNKKNTLH